MRLLSLATHVLSEPGVLAPERFLYSLFDRRSQGFGWQLRELVKGGTGVPPVNHEQDARATIKLTYYARIVELD